MEKNCLITFFLMEELPAGPETRFKQHNLRNKLKLSTLVSYGPDSGPQGVRSENSFMNILQLPTEYPPGFEKMWKDKKLHTDQLQVSLVKDRETLKKLHQKWGAVEGTSPHSELTWLYDEEQLTQINRIQESMRVTAERIRDYMITWKCEYVNAQLLSVK
jgi:hypothetical protein